MSLATWFQLLILNNYNFLKKMYLLENVKLYKTFKTNSNQSNKHNDNITSYGKSN